MPTHQGKGLGAKLLRPGLEDADRAGAETYIEASARGLPVYLKHGWEPVADEMVLDMDKYGGKGIQRQKFLMRKPKCADGG